MELELIKELGIGTIAGGTGLYLIKSMFVFIMKQNQENNERIISTTERILDTNENLAQTIREISIENRKAIEELTKISVKNAESIATEIKKLLDK